MREDLTFGTWLRQRRKELDLTQDRLAERVGCSVETIRKLEASSARPSQHMAEVLVARLEVPPADHPALVQWARGGAPPPAYGSAAAALASPAVIPPPSGPLPTNLPAPLTEFIGREHERAAVATLLQRENVRLVTLTGPGGIGKTRLGLQVAADLRDAFADGVWLVELAALTDPELVAGTIAASLPVTESGAQPVRDSLREYLGEKQILLVLDNFEQVLGAVPLVEGLLKGAPRLKVLATSRAPLHVYGEREFLVPPLTLPDRQRLPPFDQLTHYEAVRLFVERTQAVQPGFVLSTATAPAVVEICWRLDGLPLAIELAAARGKLFPPDALLARLEVSLGLLTSGVRTAPVRQQTLRAAIDWSYQLLTPAEQRLFRRMAVFQGGGTLEGLAAVSNYDDSFGGELLAGVENLVEQSLLVPRAGRSGEPRFGMLETIHEFARERLVESGEAAALQDAHARTFLALITSAQQSLAGVGGRGINWLNRLDDEHDNLRAVLRWAGDVGAASSRGAPSSGGSSRQERLAAVFAAVHFFENFWSIRGYGAEGRQHMESLLAAAEQVDGAVAGAASTPGAVAVAAFLVDVWTTPDQTTPGRTQTARLLAAAIHADASGVTEEATSAAWALLQAHAQATVAVMAEEQGDYAAAQMLGEQALAVSTAQQDIRLMARVTDLLGNIAIAQEDYPRARERLEQSVQLFREWGFEPGLAAALSNLGITLQQLGDFRQAEQLLQEALTITGRTGDTLSKAYMLMFLAHGAYRQQQWAAAAVQYRESLSVLQTFGARRALAECLEGLGWVVQVAGQPERAARLWGAVAALRQATGIPRSPFLVPLHRQAEEAARAALGDAAFAAAWAAGQALNLEAATAFALESLPPPA